MRTTFVLLFLTACLAAQQPASHSPAAEPTTAAAKEATDPVTGDIPDLISETQLGVRGHSYAGLIWWIPYEFWESQTTDKKALEGLSALKAYTVIGVFAAKVGPLGTMDFFPEEQIRAHISVRDSAGHDYAPLTEVASEADMLSRIVKPMLSASLGKAGESFALLFFPAKTVKGDPIIDPKSNGSFSVVLKDLVGLPESVYQYRTPLTSLVVAKYCPAGKERVRASWKYCPWHGVALDSASAPAK